MQVHRLVLLSGLGDGESSRGSADIYPGPGIGAVEKRKRRLGCSLANGSSDHGLHRRGRCIQHFLCEEPAVGRGHLPDPPHRRLPRLFDHAMGPERPRPGPSGLHALFRRRRMGQPGSIVLGRHHHPALVLPRPGRGRAHGGGTQGRLPRAPVGHGVGDGVQRAFGPGHAHHVVFLPRQRGRRAELAHGGSHHSGAVQLHRLFGRHGRVDRRAGSAVAGRYHHLRRCIFAPDVGLCP